MNSLLQTLFMTPEFRSALYKWNYNEEKDGKPELCIPLQLQRLFGMLQLSRSKSVETVALTKSFGWEGSEVFQQQDVQELCRVLFDALEQCFKETEAEDVIDELYAGELVDYVKCIDVDYQSERRDKFLDYSLAIRPYGSSRSMKSLTECIEHYLEPEILDGDNKYFAESVGRKVDAIKGLKFSKLPQIMSVQLKRFVYDFTGPSIVQMKINDRVTFPLVLDMNKYVSSKRQRSMSFVSDCSEDGGLSPDGPLDEFEEFLRKRIRELRDGKGRVGSESEDDSSEEEHHRGCRVSPASVEGIAGTDDLPDLVDYTGALHLDQTASKNSTIPPAPVPDDSCEDEPIVDPYKLVQERGEWVYELFAVLIHAGAISGGHYYVYIKDSDTKKWWNFDDSYVSEISEKRVLEACGGSVQSYTNYYGTKTSTMSNANAYMLMYRKVIPPEFSGVDGAEDHPAPHFPSDDMVPDYIKKDVARIQEEEERRRKEEEERYNRLVLKIHFQREAHTIITNRTCTYKDLLQKIWTELDVPNRAASVLSDLQNTECVPLDRVRLRIFNVYHKLAQEPLSTDSKASWTLDALRFFTYKDLVLELRASDEEWEPYEIDGFNLHLVEYDPEIEDFKDAVAVRLHRNATVGDLREKMKKYTCKDVSSIRFLKLTTWSYSEIKYEEVSGDYFKLITECRLYDGQKLYWEISDTPLEASPSVVAFTAQTNRITVMVNKPGLEVCDQAVIADKRWNMRRFREKVASTLDLDVNNFRLYRKNATESELNGDIGQSLFSLGFFNGICLVVMEGRPLLPGHYLFKLYLYKASNKTGFVPLALPPSEELSLGEATPCGNTSEFVSFDTHNNCGELTAPVAVPVAEVAGEVYGDAALDDIDIDTSDDSPPPLIDVNGAVFDSNIKNPPQSREDDIIGFGYKLLKLQPTKEQFEFLMELDVQGYTLINDIRMQVHEKLIADGLLPPDSSPLRVRLRQKTRYTVGALLPDGMTLKENNVSVYAGRELAVEILDREELFAPLRPGEVAVFVQRWHRSTWSLGQAFEVILSGDMPVQEISRRLAYATNVSPESLRVLLLQPYNEVKLSDLNNLSPNNPRSWIDPTRETRELSKMQWYMRDWDTILVQDASEPLKELSEGELATVAEAKANASSYGLDYHGNIWNNSAEYKYPIVNTGVVSVDRKAPRAEQGIYIKTHQDREKERLQQEEEKIDGVVQTADVANSKSILSSTANPYSLFADIE